MRSLILSLVPLALCACPPEPHDSAVLEPPDAVSSATPGVASARLASEHSGWGQADCYACHAMVHNDAGYAPDQCATCHGTNGAPGRPLAHQDAGCATCHAGSHAGVGLVEPNACLGCHPYADPGEGQCAGTESYDAVIIGAGGGGLAAAAALSRAGYATVVLEQHHDVGGYMCNFERMGYRFEASLHAIDGLDPTPHPDDPGWTMGMNVETLQALGIYERLALVRADPMYRVLYPDLDAEIPADAAAYLAQLQALFPAEADGLAAMFALLHDVDEVMRVIIAYQYAGKDIGGADAAEFFAEITERDLMDQLFLVQSLMDGTTLSEFMADYISDPALISLWTQLAGFAGAQPDDVAALFFLVMWNSYHFGGYYYVEGGSQAISDALAGVIEENGGRIRLHSLVTGIDLEGGRAIRVRTEDGACFEADWVVSNANAPATLLDMVGAEHLPTEDPGDPFHPDRLAEGNTDSLQIGLPAFQVCLGVDTDYTELFGGTHEVMIADSADVGENFQYYFDSDVERAPYAIADYTVLDPSDAPEGHNAICLTSMLMYDWEEEWRWAESHEAYQALKDEVAWKLVQRAEEDFLPGLTEHVEVMEAGSPHTLRGFTLNPRGTIFGWDNTPEQSMNHRMPQQTPIENLLLAGAWTFPGGGQSAVLSSGAIAAMSIMAAEEAGE
ncbi:MAG: FAD-dependent oxidoreductase [Pseudomonadota bacterium]